MIDEIYGDMRGIVSEGVVLAVDDTGMVQTVDVITHDGVIRTAVEVHQVAGFSSVPEPGGKALVFAVGADPANLRALPLSDTVRYGGQQNGERTFYGPDGSRVSMRQGGTIDIWAGNLVVIHTPDMQIFATGGLQITGNVTVTGTLTVTGDIIDQDGAHGSLQALRTAYDAHAHPPSTSLTDHAV
jgi:phage baseplate assembly protein V